MQRLNCGLITLERPEGNFITPIAEGFAGNGCDVEVLYSHSDWKLDKYDLLVTYGPMQSMTHLIMRLKKLDMKVAPMVFWFTEQVPSPKPNRGWAWAGIVRYYMEEYAHKTRMSDLRPIRVFLKRAGRLRALGELLTLKAHGILKLVCVFTETNSLFLNYFGIPVIVVPMGYHPQFGHRIIDLERDVDVVFLGSTRDARRKKIIRILENEMIAKGIKVVIKDGSLERGFVFGEERTLLLNRSKIMLNIMRQPWDDPVFRMILASSTGCMLVSEGVIPTSTGPFKPGVHFVMADLSDLTRVIEYYIEHEVERNLIADRAYEFVMNELTIRTMAGKILDALQLEDGGKPRG